MKFGQQLRQSLIKGYSYYYIGYDDLKNEIKNRLYPPGTNYSVKNPKEWTEDDESAFVSVLEAELDKVFTFQKVKASEIVHRIRDAEKEVEMVVKLLEDEGRRKASVVGANTEPSGQMPTEEDFIMMEEDLSDIIADVHDLAKFTQLNYTGFQKIMKKHDKQTGWTLKPIFAARLKAKPFFKDNYDAFIVKLSRLYDLVRTRGNPVEGDSSAGGSQQNFVRQTTKYWVHPENITELKLIILKHLPVLVFNPNKEFDAADSAITSVYYDNDDFDLYKGRLEKTEGAEAHRLRWYGGMDSQTIFVERKTHREDWTGEKSVKARFAIKEKNVNAFLKGEFTVEQVFEKMRKEGKKPIKEIEDLEALAREIQYTMIQQRLHPMVRSFYHRTAFQLPGDARVRISLDTELSLIREDNHGRKRAGDNWRRMDIGIDWPFKQLPAADIERFPYAILEVKLQTAADQEPPQWIRDLIASHLVEAVPKFSKFLHGGATLYPKKINLLPFWLPQMETDIRKPITHQFGIERINNSASLSTESFAEDDSDDENTSQEAAEADGRSYAHRNGNGRHGRYLAPPITAAGPSINGAPGNSLDIEERLAAEGIPEDYPLYDSDGEDSDIDDIDNNQPRTLMWRMHRMQRHVVKAGAKTWQFTKTYLIPQPHPSIAPGVNSAGNSVGMSVAKRFKAPPGKRIFVPVRIEPKVYFAVERTFLSWLEFSIYISTIAITLLNFGDTVSIWASFGFTMLAIACLMYSLGIYLWRVQKMRLRRAVKYHDKWGPTVLCALLVVCVAINFGLKMGGVGERVLGRMGRIEGEGWKDGGVNGYGRWTGID